MNSLSSLIDHTNLRPDALHSDIEILCKEAVQNKFASVCINPVYVSYAKLILKDLLNNMQSVINIEDIQKTVVSFYNLSMNDFLSARRSRHIARPRQIAMYLSKKLTTKSLPEIGRKFTGRDHTTVIHAIKKIEELMSKDRQFENEVQGITDRIIKS